MDDMENKIIIENVYVSYDKKDIIKEINVNIKEGEVVGLLGPNGAGKTTLMKAICGLVDVKKGNITVSGIDVKKDSKRALRKMGVLIEETCAYERLSGLENLKIIARMYEGYDIKKINEIVEIIGLKESIDEKFGKYSLGMKQRLGIGMALINEPDILILDEPSNGLDIDGQIEIRKLIVDLVEKRKMSVLISSHITGQLEKMCDRLLFIKKGTLIGEVNIEQLENKSLEEFYLEVMEKEYV